MADPSMAMQDQDPSFTPPQAGAVRSLRVLACVLCQQRKIKCDRNMPCANCTKANITCTPSTPAPPRRRKPQSHDLWERLAKCEDLLRQYGVTPDSPVTESPAPAALQSNTPNTLSTPNANEHGSFSPAGNLVMLDDKVKFVDSHMFRVIHENLAAIRESLSSESTREPIPFLPTIGQAGDEMDFLLDGMSSMSIDDVSPTATQVLRLWQVFRERVNPLTKIIHVPSLQPILIEAAANHSNVPMNTRALLFAIYLVSVVTLTSSEAETMLDMTRDEAIWRFTNGVKLALTQINFLKNHDMVTLQALVLYLISFFGRCNHDSAWILSGTVIRIAQKVGLHYDGEALNLSPFETEMRRRLWWQIAIVDSKYAMASGFNDPLFPLYWNTKLPSNINDDELFPSSTKCESREGPTEMAFCLIMYTMVDHMKKNHKSHMADFQQVVLSGQAADPPTPEYTASLASLARYRQVFDDLTQKIIALEQRYCDTSAGPVHEVALTIRRSFLEKVVPMITPMRETAEWGTEIHNVHDNFFRICLAHHESFIKDYDTDIERFLWFHKSHFQLEWLLFLVSQLFNRYHLGTFADRAWAIIDRMYHHLERLWDMEQPQNRQLASLVLKVWKPRESALLGQGLPVVVPECVQKLQDRLSRCSSERPSDQLQGQYTVPSGNSAQGVAQLGFGNDMLEQMDLNLNAWPFINADISEDDNIFNSFSSFAQGAPGPWW